MKNDIGKIGVRRSVRVGVPLERNIYELLECVIKIKIVMNLSSDLEDFFRFKPKNNPVLFDSAMKSKNDVVQYKTEYLSVFNLKSISDITFVAT